ncbi:DUF1295 domain-containing protein [Leptospira ognonensis]|uniref:DUF1295 domain-containing protein n=1 Tax=Leptospira ognonensis TaxID=2484945 RepID=A0A4R9JY13_9LEPT|nr:DUF1295 domain-containing protein [Leptospira ognonensis]TGL58111.1 DUF1295 domain-containing protein [Leptospira ognonensis]
MIYFPQDSIIFYAQAAIYILFGFFVFYLESSGKFNLPYSKFASNRGISPKVGMFFIYFIPILGYVSTIGKLSSLSPYHLLLLFVFVFHFGKRCLEVIFLHQFSGKIGLIGVIIITFAYTNIGILLGKNHEQMQFLSEVSPTSTFSILGIIIFFFGQAGNLYHHILLRRLRNSRGDKNYLIPNSGLFQLVVCPHYFFELISWLGIAILSRHWETYVVFFVMTCYLSGRSARTRDWYREKFSDFPSNRKRIVPFVF